MRTLWLMYGQYLLNILSMWFAEAMPEAPMQEKKGLPTWAIILIVVGVLLLCVLPICVIVVLALLGPAIGNVFSNITEGL